MVGGAQIRPEASSYGEWVTSATGKGRVWRGMHRLTADTRTRGPQSSGPHNPQKPFIQTRINAQAACLWHAKQQTGQ